MLTQMNVRIDEDLKARGDKVFAALGYTPSEVVRSVWRYAAEHEDLPAILAAALQHPEVSAADLCAAELVESARGGAMLVSSFRNALGIAPPDYLEELDYAALRGDAFDARFAERGLA